MASYSKMRSKAFTAEAVLSECDLPRLHEMFREFENFNDYERRILQAKLATMNRDARWLPSCTLIVMGIKKAE